MCFQGCEMKGTFSDLEVFGMFVGCLCHDLDHRGTNNAFQQKYVKRTLYESEELVLNLLLDIGNLVSSYQQCRVEIF